MQQAAAHFGDVVSPEVLSGAHLACLVMYSYDDVSLKSDTSGFRRDLSDRMMCTIGSTGGGAFN